MILPLCTYQCQEREWGGVQTQGNFDIFNDARVPTPGHLLKVKFLSPGVIFLLHFPSVNFYGLGKPTYGTICIFLLQSFKMAAMANSRPRGVPRTQGEAYQVNFPWVALALD